MLPTRIPGISIVGSSEIPNGLEDGVAELEHLAGKNRDAEVITKLQTLGIGYRGSAR